MEKYKILADYRGHEVEITNVIEGRRNLVSVSTTDGSKPFNKVYFGAGSSMEANTMVYQDLLDDIRIVEDDPFQPDDTQPEPEEPEYDPYMDEQQMFAYLRRGEG